MAKRPEPEEEGSGYSWMDTYGDLVTLLLCFFVLLYSFSSVDAGKWQELVGAFSRNYGSGEVTIFDASTIQEEAISKIDSMVDYSVRDEKSGNVDPDTVNSAFDLLYENIKAYIQEQGMESSLSVFRTDEAIYLRFNEMALFNSGRADILPASAETLSHIMEIISLNISSISSVRIEGHTDNVPMHNAEFRDNWDLSVKRATNVLRMVLGTGYVDATMLSAVGYGEYQPVAPNTTADGRSQNRRVDFVLMKVDTE
ncbi:Motility protein B [bioreactor metagenome]|uniref:Motility protein B n=1 Tax=bioreactor metagenome TaxID=1076179 RepID=A0A645DRA7_9ZZZZ